MIKTSACLSLLVLLLLQACSAAPRFARWDLPGNVGFADLPDRVLVQPLEESQTTGIVFYPGGLVSPAAYIPLLARLASQGVRVVIARMPLDLAVLDSDKALQLMPDYPYVQHWVLAGHSLGGAMAVEAVKKHPERFAGLILLAAYPAENTDISNLSLPVLSIAASADGLSTPAEINAGRQRLPQQTQYVQLAGGNHAQFGDYGPQANDGSASLSRDLQQDLTASAISDFLKEHDLFQALSF